MINYTLGQNRTLRGEQKMITPHNRVQVKKPKTSRNHPEDSATHPLASPLEREETTSFIKIKDDPTCMLRVNYDQSARLIPPPVKTSHQVLLWSVAPASQGPEGKLKIPASRSNRISPQRSSTPQHNFHAS